VAEGAGRAGRNLQVCAALAFVVVALVSVGGVALWAQHEVVQTAGDRERAGGLAPWLSEQPADAREVFLRAAPPAAARLSRDTLGAVNRALLLGAASAVFMALAMGLVVGRRLQEAERTRHRTLAAIAHEMRTPLTVIQGNLEAMLARSARPSQGRLAALYTQGALLDRLVADLRDVSLAEAGRLRLRRARTRLDTLCAQVIDIMRPWIDARGVRVQTRMEGDPIADADPDRLRQIVHNLVHNAVRFTPEGGLVRVAATAGPVVTLVVEDEGTGIRPEDLPHVFEAFYQGGSPHAGGPAPIPAGGSGLGLAVVRQLAEAHGGRARAETRPEGGTRFVVTLPAA
jgi:signal transduction histidine kinase